MRPSSTPSDTPAAAPPLLALVNATAEWQAGIPAACCAQVRLLDHVHFAVHRGDCVVVHHDDPAGARVLLAALSGAPMSPTRPWLHGERLCAPGVRIRRCSIPLSSVESLVAGWGHDPAARDVRAGGGEAPAVVHLLRASRRAAVTGAERAQWHGWAHRVRVAGDALVIVAPPPAARLAPTAAAPVTADALREPLVEPYAVPPGRPGARTVWLHHGRLHD